VTGGEVLGVLARVSVIACIGILVVFAIDIVVGICGSRDDWMDDDHREWYK